MNQFIKRLKPFLDKDFSPYSDSLEDFFAKLGNDQFVYPVSLSVKAKIPTEIANKLLLHMLKEGFVNHYSVPEYNEAPLEEFAKMGFNWIATEDEENELEGDDISVDELRFITAYKTKEGSLE